MSSKKLSQIKSSVGEFSLIVVGVLVALLAESWWSERQDRQVEQQILVDAATEFRQNIEILDADMTENNGVYEYLLRVEATSDPELFALSDVEASDLFAVDNQSNASFDPAMGSIDALVRGGDLRFITDHELRGHLARWSALLTQSARMDLQHTDLQIAGLYLVVPEFEADNKWTDEERRQVRDMLIQTMGTLELSMDAMIELRATAERVLERLAELAE
ncbi:MAG: hypothetical protein AAF385_03960 [Pseudomonadota bacterium]